MTYWGAKWEAREGILSCGPVAVSALKSFQDPRARGVLEVTRDLWRKINPEDPQIADACAAALRELPGPEGVVPPR
jgi:hypothetical protein